MTIPDKYDAAKNSCGAPAFVEYWAGASYVSCNLNGLTQHIDWQIDNNPISVANSWRWWDYSNQKNDINSRIAAAWSLYAGQRHDKYGVLALYRACYSADRNGLFGLVKTRLDAKDGFTLAKREAERLAEQRDRLTDRANPFGGCRNC